MAPVVACHDWIRNTDAHTDSAGGEVCSALHVTHASVRGMAWGIGFWSVVTSLTAWTLVQRIGRKRA